MCWKSAGRSSCASNRSQAGLGAAHRHWNYGHKVGTGTVPDGWTGNCLLQKFTFIKKMIRPIHNFRHLSYFLEVSGNACVISPLGKCHFESDEQTGQCHCFHEAGKPVSLICLPPGNDEKSMAQQKSCFTRVNWSKKPFPSLPTSIWPHFMHKVRKGGVFRRSYSASGHRHCRK